jgi:transposase-like protein
MPYKSERIIIANTQYDKRIKLDEDDKQQIVSIHNQGQSMRSLAREYHVDRQVIRYTIYPEHYEALKAYSREYQRTYDVGVDKRNEYKRVHRKHKQELYLEGKIK